MPNGLLSVRAAPGDGWTILPRVMAEGRPSDGDNRPAGQVKAEAARPDDQPQPGPQRSTEAEERPIRVMLVDDHRIVREGLAGILRNESEIELVAEASDGREAVEMVERTELDVIVMDVSMPRMDGTEATRLILNDHPEIRVIGLSMHDREDLANAMHEAGASAYLTKGGPASELINAIRRLAHDGQA